MARNLKPTSPKPQPPRASETRDALDLDPSYGERLAQLLPKRLIDLVARA
jgi:hypothetical protein